VALIDRPKAHLRFEVSAAFAGRSRSELLEHAAMLALLAIWAIPFTRAAGGRGVHTELLFAAALLVVLPSMQVWRAASWSVALAALVAVVALLVCVFSPSGWYGSDVAAGYAIAGAAFVAGRRYVRAVDRRNLVAVAVCLAGLYQFEQAFVVWWRSGSSSTEMSGTFGWHNPYAAFLLPGAVIGLGLVATRRSPWNIVGWASVPACTTGIVLSSSRATMAALVVAWVLVFVLGLRGKAVLSRAFGVLALSAGVLFALPSRLFFPHYSSPLAATSIRAASNQSLAQNGVYRTQFWREALDVAVHRPFVGGGFHTLATASVFYAPSDWARSPLAHDGYLQAFSDGGLLLGVPFLIAVVVVLLWAWRPVSGALRRWKNGSEDVAQMSIAVALLAAFAHSAVDFDWSHPAILVEVALLAACLAPIAAPARVRRPAVSAVALVALGGVLAVSIPALHQWQIDQPDDHHSTGHLLNDAGGTFGDYRPAQAVLVGIVDNDRAASVAQAERALRLTSREAGVDINLALLREAVGAQEGVDPAAVAQARATLLHVHGSTALYVPDLASVLSSAGQLTAARRVLSRDIADQVTRGAAAADLQGELVQWADTLGRGASYACELRLATPLLPSGTTGLPQPVTSCPGGDKGAG
jgi:O-Antigen ligase